jgi:ubiquinone biosynthesis protein UbiJ
VTTGTAGSSLEAVLADGIMELANGALALDPVTPSRLTGLDGQRFRLDVVLPPPFGTRSLTVEIRDGRLHRSVDGAAMPQVIVAGSPPALVAWLFGADTGNADAVRIYGDSALLAQLRVLASHFRPDPGMPLERVLGRDAARDLLGAAEVAGAALRSVLQGGLDSARRAPGPAWAGRSEVDRFLDRIDELRLRIDRLDARVSEQERRGTAP